MGRGYLSFKSKTRDCTEYDHIKEKLMNNKIVPSKKRLFLYA